MVASKKIFVSGKREEFIEHYDIFGRQIFDNKVTKINDSSDSKSENSKFLHPHDEHEMFYDQSYDYRNAPFRVTKLHYDE